MSPTRLLVDAPMSAPRRWFDRSRLRQLRAGFGESPERFVRRLGADGPSARAWRTWEDGSAKPNVVHLEHLCAVFDLDIGFFFSARRAG